MVPNKKYESNFVDTSWKASVIFNRGQNQAQTIAIDKLSYTEQEQ
jgi:hypothetical protein